MEEQEKQRYRILNEEYLLLEQKREAVQTADELYCVLEEIKKVCDEMTKLSNS